MMGVWSKAFIKACQPRTNLTGSEWADTYGEIPPPAAEAGRWRTSRTPYLKEILDTCTDRTTRKVVFIAGSQCGKTAALLQVLGFYIHQSPTAIMVVQPTLDAAKLFSKTRVDPMIKYSRVLSPLVERSEGNNSKRKETSTILTKTFNGGFCDMVGSNSPSGLASKAIKVLLLDEVDRYPLSAGKEGDPVKLAVQRTATFHDKKILAVSTPTNKGESKIDEMFEESDKRYFFLPCKTCGVFQHLEWSQVKWDKTEEGEHLPETARIECKHCGAQMRNAELPTKNFYEGGHWQPTAESTVAGFHVNSLYSPFWRLADLVAEWVTVVKTRDSEQIKTFKNLQLGLAWEEENKDDKDYEQLDKGRRTTYEAELHNKVLCLTAGVDVQDGYLVGECVGWSFGHESYGIEYKVFPGDPSLPQVWNDLDEWIDRPRYFADGSYLNIAVTCIDSGGHHTSDVYRFCKAREHKRVFAIKGSSIADKAFISQPSRVGEKKDTLLFSLGVNSGKATIMSALNLEKEGPMYCHFPRSESTGYNTEYFMSLKSEKYVHEFKNGVHSAKWVKLRPRNEGLDCRNYAQAAREILKPPYDQLQRLRDEGKQAYIVNNIQPVQQKRTRTLSKGITL